MLVLKVQQMVTDFSKPLKSYELRFRRCNSQDHSRANYTEE